MASINRRPLYINSSANPALPLVTGEASPPSHLPLRFHKLMPGYSPSPLVSLKSVAEDIGVQDVYLKFEGERFGLPSFKILGASWSTFRMLAAKLGLPLDSSIDAVKSALRTHPEPVTLFAATDGNHGRAVARMGAIMGIPAQIYIPRALDPITVAKIREEGATVTELDATYDVAVQTAYEQAGKTSGGVLVQDTAFEGYEEIPTWIVEGYSTMMLEIDGQLQGKSVDLVVVPVGVGSFAQAVVSHCKAEGKSTPVLTVEPDTAACLYKSLIRGNLTSVETTVPTIMTGLDCGTVSSIAWPILKDGVDASITVSDYESHKAVKLINSFGVSPGPCGAAPLAALRRLTESDKAALGIDRSSVIVLLCTEGQREYTTPKPVVYDDAVSLCQALVRINSAIPGSGEVKGPGETEIAQYITAWLEHRDIECHWIEKEKGRPSVIGVVNGTGGGKSLMLNGHIDTVTTASYAGDATSGHIENGKLYGRGAADMKSGIAAMLVATANAKKNRLKGDVIFTGVADEEDMSMGTEQVLEAGWRADAAIVCEPTNEHLVTGHKGFTWFEIDVHGVAAHGSRFDLGVDAVAHAGYVLVELDKYAKRLRAGPAHPFLGLPSVHASMIRGGEEPASYAAKCTIVLERRTVAGETADTVRAEIEGLLQEATRQVPDLKYDLRSTFSRNPFEIAKDHPLVSLIADQIRVVRGKDVDLRAEAFWTDCALIADVGIPVVMYGPHGEGLHAKEEWASVESIEVTARTIIGITQAFCGRP
ncbi:hypothetical protein jhhlp_005442 [Lomentospora prolificans]|uniref:Succinyl-diaminopimelate desuccinylase n=1 Tax=Lomentospora prolificans TaxID=41688 RepID=A0A2N3N6W5_9PEZI|nr:hypothetical protein jhhlp_005442 [Lomentospora prolificans]